MGVQSGARVWKAGAALAALATGAWAAPLPTTVLDFKQGGSQPGSMTQSLATPAACLGCHWGYDPEHEPGTGWINSMMGQAARDPIFYAAVAIANQDVAEVGEFCLRCHAPMGWIEGRSVPADGSALAGTDLEGISCTVCHRMVDPVYVAGQSPGVDQQILAALPNPVPGTSISNPPPNPGNASYIFDPMDRRRGPYALPIDHVHGALQSPFHRSSSMCGTCHDVSNPAFSKNPDGSYTLNPVNQAHPTGDKHQMFQEQRTYSEWLVSEFAQGPVALGERYGSNQAGVSSCQDCHMPKSAGFGCAEDVGGSLRTDLGRHFFAGSNTWVLRAIRSVYGDFATRLTPETVDAAVERNLEMLRDASDLELFENGSMLVARIVNQTGHKLPTGYPEGRRMWLNVRFLDAGGQLIAEHGAYDAGEAHLHVVDTKVYEAVLGIDEYMAGVLNRPAGPQLSFAVSNFWYKDNRIPPRGFTNANFAMVQASPVGYAYADGQYWDDTEFAIPPAAARAEVRVMYQTTSREYIEFLRDANTTNQAGQIAHNQWVLHGKSDPVEMDRATIVLGACPADVDDGSGTGTPDGGVTIEDLLFYLVALENGDVRADLDDGSGTGTPDGGVTVDDLIYFLARFELGC